MILLVDAKTARILDADREAVKYYGRSLERLEGKSLFALHPALSAADWQRALGGRIGQSALLRLSAAENPTLPHDLEGSCRLIGPDATPKVLVIADQCTGAGGPADSTDTPQALLERRVQERTAELIAANQQLRQEMAQRLEAQLALLASEKQYSTLVENSLMGIHINVQGRIVFANQRFAEMHGYRREELIGEEIQRLVHPDDREMVLGFMACRFQGLKAPREYEARGLTKDGRTIWLMRNATVIEYQGEPAILGNTLDISPRKRMEQSLRQSEKQLQVLSAQLIDAQECERERVAQELHDGIGQYLTAIKYRLEAACDRIARTNPQADLSGFSGIVPVIQQAVEEVRRISMDLRPSILTDLGIKATLDWYFREVAGLHSDLGFEWVVTAAEGDIPDPLKLVIYRLVQEGIHNIVRHSGADRVTVRLARNGERLGLTIEDNGRGFQVAEMDALARGGKGFGLAGMKKRTELSGGEFQLESEPGHGTRLEALWQLHSL